MMTIMFRFIPDTFRTVEEELLLFGGAVLLGIPAGAGFDIMRLVRRLIPHRSIAVAAEDILFLVLISFLLLCYTTAFAGGDFRIYYVLGCSAGFVLYECTIGMVIMQCCDTLLRPVRWAGRRIAWICEKLHDKFVKCAKKSGLVKKNTPNCLQDCPRKVYNKRDINKKAGNSNGRQNKKI